MFPANVKNTSRGRVNHASDRSWAFAFLLTFETCACVCVSVACALRASAGIPSFSGLIIDYFAFKCKCTDVGETYIGGERPFSIYYRKPDMTWPFSLSFLSVSLSVRSRASSPIENDYERATVPRRGRSKGTDVQTRPRLIIFKVARRFRTRPHTGKKKTRGSLAVARTCNSTRVRIYDAP